MKVGILTFHHTTNYGATLQTYALYQATAEQGFEVELIDYRPSQAVKYYLKQLSPIRRSAQTGLPAFNWRFIGETVKSWKMRRFLLSKMRMSSEKIYSQKGLKAVSNQYDIIVCGSDQIWNIKSIRGFDASYWLDFVSEKSRKVSYAASAGRTESLGRHLSTISQLLQDFDAISVRDAHTQKLIAEACGIKSQRVLDPTFLGKYDSILQLPKLEHKYLLIYNDQELTSAEEEFIKAVAEFEKLKIVSIGFTSKLAHSNVIGVGPEEWLGYFSKASYVITDHFHGSIFSVLFKKPFTVLSRPGKFNKLHDLLSILGLENRIFSEKSNPQPFPHDHDLSIDYRLVQERVDQETNNSRKFLQEALHGEH